MRTTPRAALAALLALAGALAGCAAAEVLHPGDASLPLVLTPPPATERRDPASIEEAGIEGDHLVLRVSTGGGCREHLFAVRTDGAFRESSPVQISLHLAHDAQGDACRAIIRREVVADLAPLKAAYLRAYGRPGTLVLHLHEPGAAGSRHAVQYRF